MKECTTCKVLQPFKNYYKEARGAGGMKARCKTCEVAYQKKWASANKDKIKLIAKRYAKNKKGKLTVICQPPAKKPKDLRLSGIVKPTSINGIEDLLILRDWFWMTIGECPPDVIYAIERVSLIDCI